MAQGELYAPLATKFQLKQNIPKISISDIRFACRKLAVANPPRGVPLRLPQTKYMPAGECLLPAVLPPVQNQPAQITISSRLCGFVTTEFEFIQLMIISFLHRIAFCRGMPEGISEPYYTAQKLQKAEFEFIQLMIIPFLHRIAFCCGMPEGISEPYCTAQKLQKAEFEFIQT